MLIAGAMPLFLQMGQDDARLGYVDQTGQLAIPTIETPDGSRITGALAWQDEFTIALTDAAGRYRSWPTSRVAFEVSDPMQAHVDRLALYTDDDIHDVYAYLETLTGENTW